jgi:hypothetical protein
MICIMHCLRLKMTDNPQLSYPISVTKMFCPKFLLQDTADTTSLIQKTCRLIHEILQKFYIVLHLCLPAVYFTASLYVTFLKKTWEYNMTYVYALSLIENDR